MILCNCLIHLDLPEIESLKGRRAVTNSLKQKLKSFNISVLDVSGSYAKEADVAFVFLSPTAMTSAQYRDKIEQMIERNFGEFMFELEYEEL